MNQCRVGFGFDVHRSSRQKKDFILAGVKIPCSFSLAAVSDGDVVLHAVADALCGAACLGDIGDYFPPAAKASKGMDSKNIVKLIQEKIAGRFAIVNLDITIVAQKPPLAKHKPAMLKSLRRLLALEDINIKIKSKEGLDILGGRNAIAVLVTVLLQSC